MTNTTADASSALAPQPDMSHSHPTTPEPQHAEAGGKSDTVHMTPPPSSQAPRSTNNSRKSRTPTPTFSHISTPPPTVEIPATQTGRTTPAFVSDGMSLADIDTASPDELRSQVAALQTALRQAKTSAAHHKLHYEMLAQESAAAIERMVVEARMAQCETHVIHHAEQAKAAATPSQPSTFQEGMIPVQKDLYQHMCREIQHLVQVNQQLEDERARQERTIASQESEIASLGDKVSLMRERILENREHLNQYRRNSRLSRFESTPRSIYSTPHRRQRQDQSQDPLHALVQASEMASSQEARRPSGQKKGHSRNTHSMSSLPTTPHRVQKPVYQTPSHRQTQAKVPSTAPLPRTSALRTPNVYSQHLPVAQHQQNTTYSEGTVSADNDSEAETDIIEDDEIGESQASRTASQMLRTSQEQQSAKRESFKGPGMKQTTLFGSIQKPHLDRGPPPSKRARTDKAVGLGIEGVRD